MIPLYCEGETEGRVLRPLLREIHDRLRERGSGLRVYDLRGAGNFKPNLARVVRVHRQKNELPVFALMDLYGAPVEWPAGMTETADRVGYLISEMREWAQAGEEHFHPHVAVHELEAWILADPQAISKRLGGEHGPWDHPEDVDFDKPPSARLDELYRQRPRRPKSYTRNKAEEAPLLFESVRLERVRETCPNFRRFVEDLESMA